MKNYKYDYDRTCFQVLKNMDGELKYYLIDHQTHGEK